MSCMPPSLLPRLNGVWVGLPKHKSSMRSPLIIFMRFFVKPNREEITSNWQFIASVKKMNRKSVEKIKSHQASIKTRNMKKDFTVMMTFSGYMLRFFGLKLCMGENYHHVHMRLLPCPQRHREYEEESLSTWLWHCLLFCWIFGSGS